MIKQSMLDSAELIDAWRVFPRIFLVGYGVLAWSLVSWAMSLPVLTVEQAGLVGVVTGLFVPMTNWYFQTGRSWST